MTDSSENYKSYISNWLNDNFMYFSSDFLSIHVPISPDLSIDPYAMMRQNIIDLKLNNNEYKSRDDKNAFFNVIIEKVFREINDVLLKCLKTDKESIMEFLYGSLIYNRYLGQMIVKKQDGKCVIIDNNKDDFLQILFTVMELSDDNCREIEQYIATQEDAIELLIKISYSCDFSENNDVVKRDLKKVNKLFSLSHLLVLLIHTKQDLTIGINKDKKVFVDNDGIIDVIEAFQWGNLSLDNYNYKFSQNFDEYSRINMNQLSNSILQELGFNLDDVNILQKYLISKMRELVVVADESEWMEKFSKLRMNMDRALKLFEYFKFRKFSEIISLEQLHKYVNANYYPMLSQKVYIESNHLYICYTAQAVYALEYFRSNVFNNPHKFVANKKIVDKVSNSFCDSIATKLKASFEEAQITLNYHFSQSCPSDREIDIIFVLYNVIFLIECKRLSFPLSNTGIHNEYKQLIGKYTYQLNAEIQDFLKYQERIKAHLQSCKLIQFNKNIDYKVKEIIVVKEFSPSQIHNNSIIREDQLIQYIKDYINLI
ncbi:hypothetical protein HQN90_01265 [Paenibacillus alba]|uniref:hypothetical protein n=1 Tax=Paenibacillus alba TaxID=1197127 RepID=UPI001566C116|nr:hypothetical protein [Paenibacillus alba]NQX64745.1 hypothetical protein [Paenibacillus alba]